MRMVVSEGDVPTFDYPRIRGRLAVSNSDAGLRRHDRYPE